MSEFHSRVELVPFLVPLSRGLPRPRGRRSTLPRSRSNGRDTQFLLNQIFRDDACGSASSGAKHEQQTRSGRRVVRASGEMSLCSDDRGASSSIGGGSAGRSFRESRAERDEDDVW